MTWSSCRVVVLPLVAAWYLLWFRSLVTGLVLVVVSLIDLALVLLLAVELVLLSRRVVVVASPVLVVVSLLLLVVAPTCFRRVVAGRIVASYLLLGSSALLQFRRLSLAGRMAWSGRVQNLLLVGPSSKTCRCHSSVSIPCPKFLQVLQFRL